MTCGGGEKRRTRRKNVEAVCGGKECGGESFQVESCGVENCPVDCEWGEWGGWEECSAECGGGSQLRRRNVDIMEKFGGEACSGVSTEERFNLLTYCYINFYLILNKVL